MANEAQIDALYLAGRISSRKVSARIEVALLGGGLLTVDGITSAEYTFNFGEVPVARIKVSAAKAPNLESRVAFRAPIRLLAGYNGLMTQQFTGYVIDMVRAHDGITLVCDGSSWALSAQFHEDVFTFNNTLAADAINSLLTTAAITARSVVIDAWTVAVNGPITINFSTYGEGIKKIAEVDGGEWFEMPDGAVRVRDFYQLDKWLTSNVGRSYAPQHLREYNVENRVRDTKNQCFVRGGTYTQTNPDGSTDSVDAEGQANATSPWVKNPDGSQAYNDINFTNELIDDLVKAAATAGRIVNYENGLHRYITATVDGDPLISCGMSVRFSDNFRIDLVAGVTSYTSKIEGDDWTTVIQAISIDNTDAASIFPIAIFFHGVGGGAVEIEEGGNGLLGNYTFDGTASRSFDGQALTYLWSDNQGIVSGTTPIVSGVFDPAVIVPPWLVTLEVTNSSAQSDSVTHTIQFDITTPDPGGFGETIILPNMLAALLVDAGLSVDAAQSWNDVAIPEGAISCVLAPPISSSGTVFDLIVGLVGTETGRIYQLVNGVAIPVIDVAGASPIVHVWFDLVLFDVAWAITEDGRILRSNGLGGPNTWFDWDNLRIVGVTPKPNLRSSRIATPQPAGLWIFGGGPEGGMIAIDPVPDHNWFAPAIGGELLADLGGFADSGLAVLGNDQFVDVFDGSGHWREVRAAYAGGGAGYGAANYRFFRFASGNIVVMKRTNFGPHFGAVYFAAPADPNTTIILDGATPFGTYQPYGIDLAADGRVMVAYASNSTAVNAQNTVPLLIYESSTEGAGYTIEHTDPGFGPGNHQTPIRGNIDNALACDKLDNNRMLVICGLSISGNRPTVIYRDSGGWHQRITPAIPRAATVSQKDLVALNSGRMMLTQSTGAGSPIALTDNLAATWFDSTFVSAAGETYTVCAWRAGMGDRVLLGLTRSGGNAAGVLISSDNAANFTPLAIPDFPESIESMEYDVSTDTLYVLTADDVVSKITGVYGTPVVSSIVFPDLGAALQVLAFGGASAAVAVAGFIRDAASREQNELAIILDTDTNVPAVYYTANIFGDGSDWKRALGAPNKSHGRWIAPDLEVGKFAMGFDDNIVYLGDVSGGVMTITEAPLSCDSGEAQNHGQWLGAVLGDIAGVYIVCTEDAGDGYLYKTFDRFQTTLAKIRPSAGGIPIGAGQKAKMISVGQPLGTQVPSNGGGDPPPAPGDPPPPPPTPPPPAPGDTRVAVDWPFAQRSIWNMPIGSTASYVPAGIGAETFFTTDTEFFIRPAITDPVQPFYSNGVFGVGRCAQTSLEYSLHFPNALVIPDAGGGATPNNCAAVLDATNGRTLKQMNPIARCVAAGPVTFGFTAPDGDIEGDGILGSHGGSGLSSVGGCLRLGEIVGGAPIRHALKFNLFGHHYYSQDSGGFRWPAVRADSYYISGGGIAYGGPLPQLRIGALLAIKPSDFDALNASLQSAPARKLAWTLLNYGAYCVDDTAFSAHAICVESGVFGEFNAAYGFDIEQDSGSVGDGLDWYNDMLAILAALSVVNNNAPPTIGGGGVPRQPLAPASFA